MAKEYCTGVKVSHQCKRCERVTNFTEVVWPCRKHVNLWLELLRLDDQALSYQDKVVRDSMERELQNCQQQWPVEDSKWEDEGTVWNRFSLCIHCIPAEGLLCHKCHDYSIACSRRWNALAK